MRTFFRHHGDLDAGRGDMRGLHDVVRHSRLCGEDEFQDRSQLRVPARHCRCHGVQLHLLLSLGGDYPRVLREIYFQSKFSTSSVITTDVYIRMDRELDPFRLPGLLNVLQQPFRPIFICAPTSDIQRAETVSPAGISLPVAGHSIA